MAEWHCKEANKLETSLMRLALMGEMLCVGLGIAYECWFSMSPLLKLHHHNIMTIVELLFMLTIVELLHHATTKVFCHTLTQRKKKKGKTHSLALALTLTLSLRPDHSATMHC